MHLKSKFRNVSYTLSSNLINMLVSLIMVVMIPKFIGVKQYSYLQFYIFVSSYATLFTLGWTDGISLRYTGLSWESIQKKYLSQQLKVLIGMQFLFCILIVCYSFVINDPHKAIIMRALGIFTVLVNVRYFFVHLSQAVINFKLYSEIIIIDRVLYIFLTVGLLLLNVKSFEWFILADLLSKLIALIFAGTKYKSVFKYPIDSNKDLLKKEILENINSGSKVLFSSTTSMLIIGIVRFSIERIWDIETFGKVSLTLNLSNFILVFISAIGIVFFPLFRKMKFEKLKIFYFSLMSIMDRVLLLFLICYFPLAFILKNWLPAYRESIYFMGLVFPICNYEAKVSLLITPTLKALRLEKELLKLNFSCFLISLFLCVINYLFLKNLLIAILTITLVLFIRSSLGNYILMKRFKEITYKSFLSQLLGSIIFIISNYFFPLQISAVIYGLFIIIYMIGSITVLKESLFIVRKSFFNQSM